MRYPRDPATDYALKVIRGREVASRSVVLACQRHIDDLAHATDRGLVWRPAEARAVCQFFPEVLRLPETSSSSDEDHEDGRPFGLAGWEQFIAGSIMGWHTTSGHQRYRVAYVEVGKGSGKTAFGAGLAVFRLVTGAPSSQHYFVATAQHQARLAFDDAQRMVAASPHLRALAESRVNALSVRSTGAFLKPISSEKKGLDGKRITTALIDEVHEADEMVVGKVRGGTKGTHDALILEITNAGFDRESVCWRHHQHSREVLTGVVDDPSWFAFLCHLDCCATCAAAGAYQPQDDCPDCEDWQVEGPHWRKANPGLDSALPWQYLREQVREAVQIPSQRNLTRRLNFCQWLAGSAVWISPDRWAACGDPTLTPALLAGRECFIGVDLSAKIDLSAVVCVFPRPLSGAVTTDSVQAAVPLNTAVDVLPYFWCPEATIHRRAHEDHVPMPDWARAGWLNTTPGDVIDHDAILECILDLSRRFKVRAIGIDMAGAVAMVTRLQRELSPELVIEVPQGFRHLSEPSKQLEALVVSQQLRHPDNKVMNWCMSNLAIEENKWQEIRPIKVNQRTRIDGGTALILALAMLLRQPPAPEPPTYDIFVLGDLSGPERGWHRLS
jgi:phage terminase large subunit-like protein